MSDRNGNGSVSVEEAMQILYLRHGKHMLDEQLTEIFGTSDTSSTRNLNLTEFLQSLNTSQVKQMRQRLGTKSASSSSALGLPIPQAAKGSSGQRSGAKSR